MKVKKLIAELQKLPPDTIVGTMASKRMDFCYTPISEIVNEDQVELHEDFRVQGKKRFSDWVILVGANQEWHPASFNFHKHLRKAAPKQTPDEAGEEKK